jgi:hypothetical protein
MESSTRTFNASLAAGERSLKEDRYTKDASLSASVRGLSGRIAADPR